MFPFGKSKIKEYKADMHPKVTFASVAGLDEAKVEVIDIDKYKERIAHSWNGWS